MSLSSSSAGRSTESSGRHVHARLDLLDRRAHAAGGVLELVARARAQRRLVHPADRRLDVAGDGGRAAGRDDHVAAADVELVGEHHRRGQRRLDRLGRPARGVDARDRRALAGGQHEHLVARAQHAAGHAAGVAAVVRVADRELHREAEVLELAVLGDLELLELVEQRRPVEPRRALAAVDHVVAVERRHRDRAGVVDPEPLGHRGEALLDLAEARLVELDEVHLVHAGDQVADAEQRRDRGVPARLLDDPGARVDEHERGVGRRGARDHVARVADVARGVGDDERALRRREEAVGDVDRDALLALRAQAVDEVREVDLGALHLVGHQRLGVVEQPPDQGALAVVDRAGGGQAEELSGA